MKICICTTGAGLDSPVSPVFARAPYFLFIDSKTEKFKSVPNPVSQYGRGAGIAASQQVASEGAKIVISGNVGPNAFSLLKASGIEIYNGVGLTAQEALNKYKKGELTEISQAQGPFGMGFGRGRGFGRGLGRGGGFGRGLGQGGGFGRGNF
ncbi:NifB/NifX family molybdenum-iron cluster-binding protein [bacterium]|nr:NifB/NifX family molybdenum-iron cluster-binding protein [bacterium]